MERFTTMILLLLVASMADGQEKQIWACQETQSTGLSSQNDVWEKKSFYANNFMLTLNGANSSLRDAGADYPMECSYLASYYSCASFTKLFILKASTGFAAYSTLGGAVRHEKGEDSLVVSVLQCVKS